MFILIFLKTNLIEQALRCRDRSLAWCLEYRARWEQAERLAREGEKLASEGNYGKAVELFTQVRTAVSMLLLLYVYVYVCLSVCHLYVSLLCVICLCLVHVFVLFADAALAG